VWLAASRLLPEERMVKEIEARYAGKAEQPAADGKPAARRKTA
jgi:hypothetical protein